MKTPSHHPCSLLSVVALIVAISMFPLSLADVGTASYYGPPYLPTVCYGSDEGQFPAGSTFAAAAKGIWDNGASCGREYLVRCLSSATAGACVAGQTIKIKIVNLASALDSLPSSNATTMILSTAAYRMIASTDASVINIEFARV